MKFKILILPTILAFATLSGCQTFPSSNTQTQSTQHNPTSAINSADSEQRKINQVRWNKTGNIFEVPSVDTLNDNQSQIVFFRPMSDTNPINNPNQFVNYEDGVIIGIDQRFHSSLHPGRFSQVIVCSGEQTISTEIATSKTNFLDNPILTTSLKPQNTYYFLVNVDENNSNATLTELNESQAITLLQNVPEQTHQINRVIADDCPVVTPEPVEPIVVDEPITLDVLFDFDSANIRSNYQPKLKAIAEFMHKFGDVRTVLEGHTDNRGNEAYNLQLSQQRANAVKNVLVSQYGIANDRIETLGYGESQPIDTNDTTEGRQNNRRVIAIINQQDK